MTVGIMILNTNSESETEALGTQLASRLKPGAVIALYGDLGAGKTAFVRGLARGLGISERITSPTYTIVNEYNNAIPFFHFDMYRIGSEDELLGIGWYDYLARGGICAVEWSENISGVFTGDEIKIKIHRLSETGRRIDIEVAQDADFSL
jgi:tRNA threonylcarbamoyladenosine biosynthesis protein TsaE